uniref:LysR substrate-binding domain-containing protein n=2 Tax=cellular organisms TaxID=131567 RepID=A0A8R2HBQ8_ACYPI|eukprot:XP_016664194.1 PREDICTED: uncharacterized HTH-type transcriptional regulator YbdO-like [Acyrthosiphon pisum]
MEELQEEKFTLFLSSEPGVKKHQSIVEQLHANKTIGFRCDSLLTIITMLSTSDLVGFLPEFLFEKYKDVLRLKKINIPYTLPITELFMIYNRSALNSSVFSAFIEKITEK